MSTRTRSRRVLALAAVGFSFGLGACSADSSVSPSAQLPTTAMNTATEQVGAITADPTIVALFGPTLSGGSYTLDRASSGGAGALFTRIAATGARALRFGATPRMMAALPTPLRTTIGTSSGMTIPQDMWGNVYVHDASNNYVVDAQGTGAPANGFRIMLYPWNPSASAGQQWGTTPVGYADVMDEGTATEEKIVVDMYATGGANPVITFKVADAAADGGARADTLAGTLNAAGGKTMSYEFAGLTTGIGTATERTVTKVRVDVPGSSFQINGTLIDGLQANDVQTVSAKFGSDEVEFSVATVLQNDQYTTSDTTSISYNGKLAGYLLDNPSTGQPALVKPDGTEMGMEQKLALMKLSQTFGEVFGLVAVTSFFALWAIALGLLV